LSPNPVASRSTVISKEVADRKAVLDHANALFMALHDMALEALTSTCKCATCEIIRKNAVHVKALFKTGVKIKHIEAA
jgi:hypothetical protein